MQYSIKILFDPIYTKLESILGGKLWYIKAVFICLLGIAIFSPPTPYFYSKDYQGGLFVETVMNRANNIFSPPNYGNEILHESKTYFRVFIPILCKTLNISNFQTLYLIQSLIGMLFLLASILLAFKITQDRVAALFCGLCLTFLYVGKAAFHDISGWFDSFAYFFLIISLFELPFILHLIFLNFAYFTDERALLSAIILCMFHSIKFENKKLKIKIFQKSIYAIIFSVLIYVVIRLGITYFFDFKNIIPNENLHIKHLTHTFWSGFEGIWILLVVSILILMKEMNYVLIFFYLLSILIFATMVLNIGDQTRSIAYIFPMVFVSLLVASKFLDTHNLRLILFFSLIITLLYPADFYINGFERSYFQPVYIKTLKSFFPNSVF